MKAFFSKAQDPVSCGTHTYGAVAALTGGFLMLIRAVFCHASMLALAGAMCFCLSTLALYSASAVYHFYPGNVMTGGVKRLLRKMDHSMIYVMIAGSYTPFAIVLLPQPKGLHFCMVLWGIALVGILAKMLWLNAPRILSTAIYLMMGWAILFVAKDFSAVGQLCLTWIALGGICYSVGAVFYAIKKPNTSPRWTFHEWFHLLILAGSLFHYIAVFFYVL